MRILAPLLLFLMFAVAPAAGQQAAEHGPGAIETSGVDADVEALIRILENDDARSRLIDNLRTAAQRRADQPSASSEQTIAYQIAEYTRGAAQNAAGLIGAIAGLAYSVGDVLSGATTIDVQALWNVVRNILFVVAVTFAVYLTLGLALRRLQHVLAGIAINNGIIRRLGIIGLSAVADAATVFAAWSAGYIVAMSIDETGQMGINRALFLNAFLFIELIKVTARTLFAPRWPPLRFGRIDDTTAAYWYFWLSRLVSVVGYTFLFIAPILATNVSNDAAEALRVIVMLAALAMAAAIILQNRNAVRARLMRRAEAGRTDTLSRSLAALARIWHIVAIGYLILVFALWLADRETALPFVLAATAQSLVAIVVGIALTAVITRLSAGGMHLPADVRERLPLLERRLNAFVPNVLRVVRVVVTIAVVLTIGQVWQVADFVGWLSSEAGQRVVTSLISAILILLVGWMIYLAVQSWVEYRLNPNYGRVPTPRERTLLSLFRNAFTIVLSVLVAMLVLSELGVNIGPLLAGAGVVGLAIGFGAQKLVQDIITGAFIQFENAMNEGDVVTAAGITGVVERLTIRSVSLRALDGTYHLIPFSSVDSVSNLTKHFSYHVAEIGVAYRERIPEVKQAMQDAFERLKQTEFGGHIIGDLDMHGVTEFRDSAVVVRARIKTTPGEQWALGRAYNEIIKTVFDERDIEIPFPHVTLYLSQDAEGPLPLLDAERRQTEASHKLATKPGYGRAMTSNASTNRSKHQRKVRITQDAPPGEDSDPPDENEV